MNQPAKSHHSWGGGGCADELTFSFSSVSYLSKDPTDLFSHISSLRTPSSPCALSAPTRAQLLKMSFYLLYVLLSPLISFTSLTAAQQSTTRRFPEGRRSCLLVSDVEVLVLPASCPQVFRRGGDCQVTVVFCSLINSSGSKSFHSG